MASAAALYVWNTNLLSSVERLERLAKFERLELSLSKKYIGWKIEVKESFIKIYYKFSLYF